MSSQGLIVPFLAHLEAEGYFLKKFPGEFSGLVLNWIQRNSPWGEIPFELLTFWLSFWNGVKEEGEFTFHVSEHSEEDSA